MKLPLNRNGVQVCDATGRIIISSLNPIDIAERDQIVKYVNETWKRKQSQAGETSRICAAYETNDPFRDLAARAIPCVRAAVKHWKWMLEHRVCDKTIEGQIRQAEKLYETLDYLVKRNKGAAATHS